MTQEKYLQVIFEEINEIRRNYGIPLVLSYKPSVENGKVIGIIELSADYIEVEYYNKFEKNNFLEIALGILEFIEKIRNSLQLPQERKVVCE